MKRVKIALAVGFVLIVVVAVSREDGLIRRMFSDVTSTEAMAEPQDETSKDPSAEKTELTESTAEDVAAEAEPKAENTKDSAEDDTDPADDGKADVVIESASGDPNQSEETESFEDFTAGIIDSFVDVRYDPNYGGESWDAAEDLPEEVMPEPMESINLNNVEMKNIIQTLGEWTELPIIPTDDAVMSKRITIYATKKVPRSKALALILAALKAKGVVAEWSEDKIFLKPIATAIFGSVPTLPADEPLARIIDKSQIVEKFFKLDNYSPTKVASIITPLIAEYGHVTAMEDTGIIAVIDSVDNLIRVERIIKQLDVPESEQTVEEVFQIVDGDPIEIVQVIELILDTERRDRSRGPSRPPSSGGSSGSKAATSVVIQQGEIPVRLIPIPKHNWIIARASAEEMKQIAEWIKKLDRVESVRSEQTIIQVRYADVREIEDALDNTIRQMSEEIRTNVIIEPLTQAKQLIVFGSAENRKMIERLVAEMDMPRRDIYVQETFKLDYADADQIKENIDGLYGDSAMNNRGYNPYGGYSRYGRGSSSDQDENVVKVVAYPTQNQVIVIASEKNMAKIRKQIKEEWDIPLDIEKDQYRILTLRNSDPVQMSNLLAKLFSEDGGGGGSQNLMRFIFGGSSRTDSQKKIVGSLYGMLTFEPVPDTKKIIVISKIPQAYEVIEKLVTQLDSKEKAEVPRVITLKYADAEDLCDQLNAILNEAGTQATLQRSTRGLSPMEGDGSGGISSSGAASGNNNNETITPWWTRQRSNAQEEMPTSNLIGQVRFIPVARSKAILVLAPPEYMEDIEAMVAELDKPGMQVMIKVVIVEVNHSSMTSLGVQLATGGSGLTDRGDYFVGSFSENAANVISNWLYQGSIGGTAITVGADISTLIDLLVKNVNAKILNQPTLWTKDNEEAIFIKGRRVAFIEGDQNDGLNGLTRNFNYNDVGLTLRIRPSITPEKSVDMTINLGISGVEAERINDEIAISNLDTTTHLIVNNGQTIMMGGILFQKESTIKRKVPFLGDIPILGELFKHTEKQLSNDELLCFVTPYVIDSNSLNAIPVDTDTTAQLERPFRKMEKIRGHLDEAMRWLGEEIGEEYYDENYDEDRGWMEEEKPEEVEIEIVPSPTPDVEQPETPVAPPSGGSDAPGEAKVFDITAEERQAMIERYKKMSPEEQHIFREQQRKKFLERGDS